MSEPDFSILIVAANRCVADRLGAAVATVGGETMRPSFGFVIRAVAAELAANRAAVALDEVGQQGPQQRGRLVAEALAQLGLHRLALGPRA